MNFCLFAIYDYSVIDWKIDECLQFAFSSQSDRLKIALVHSLTHSLFICQLQKTPGLEKWKLLQFRTELSALKSCHAIPEWSFPFTINWSCQLALQSCKSLRLLEFVDFQLWRNILIPLYRTIFMHERRAPSKRVSLGWKLSTELTEWVSEWGGVGTIVKTSRGKWTCKKLFHTSLYFNSCKIINFSPRCHEKRNTVGNSKINTLNGVSNKTLLMEISFSFCSITQ